METPERIVNASLRAPFLRLAEQATRIFTTKSSKKHKQFVKQVLAVQSQSLEIIRRPKVFGKLLERKIEQRHRQDNASVAQRYFSGLSAEHHSDFLWN